MKYLKKVDTKADIPSNVEIPSVYFAESENEVFYFGFDKLPLFLTALEDDFSITFSKAIDYSVDNCNTWQSLSYNTATPAISAGEKIYFRNVVENGDLGTFSTNKRYNVSGNILSLCYGNEFVEKEQMPYNTYADRLFKETAVVDASNLILPSVLSDRNKFSYMFYGCASLTQAPVLPAKELLESGTYEYMFYNCTSLTSAPALPATTLAASCYYSMFYGCTSLTQAPELPATTLVSSCYYSMFRDCSKVSYVKMVATDVSADSALFYWLRSVAAQGTFVKAAGVTLPSGMSGIPDGWTVQEV